MKGKLQQAPCALPPTVCLQRSLTANLQVLAFLMFSLFCTLQHFLGHLKKHDLEQIAGQTILDLTITDDGDEVPVKGFSFPSYVDFSRMSLPPTLLW